MGLTSIRKDEHISELDQRNIKSQMALDFMTNHLKHIGIDFDTLIDSNIRHEPVEVLWGSMTRSRSVGRSVLQLWPRLLKTASAAEATAASACSCGCCFLCLELPTTSTVDRRPNSKGGRSANAGGRGQQSMTHLSNLVNFQRPQPQFFRGRKKGRVFLNIFCWFYYFLRIHFCFHCSFDVFFFSTHKIFCQTVMKS